MSEPNSKRTRDKSEPRRRPQMSNYYRSGAAASGSDSPFSARKKPSKKLGKFFTRSVDIILVLGLLFILIRSSIVSSSAKIEPSSTFYHSLTNYQDSAKSYLSAVSDKTKITFNQDKLAADFKKNYPEINTVSVELPVFSQEPVVRLQIAPPAFILNSDNKQYIVDSDGRVVGSKSQFAKKLDLKEVTDQSGFTASLGKQTLSSDNVLFITDIINQLKTSKVDIKALVLSSSPSELDVYTTDKSYYTKVYLNGDPATQIGQFLAARHEFAAKNIQPTQYLDVRVSGRIFYK